MQKYTYVVFITLNYKDKQNNLEILSLWILPIVTTLVKYKTNASQLTMIFVCRSKCICLLSHRLIVAGTGTPFPSLSAFKLCNIFQLYPSVAAWQRAPDVFFV